MHTIHRDYDDKAGDFHVISRFIFDNSVGVRRYSTWCIGRFVDWRYAIWDHKSAVPDFWAKNAHLWLDGFGQLAGFAISEEGRCDIAIITAEGYRFLFEEILGWAVDNWGDRQPALSIEITEYQQLESGVLERHGFQHASTFVRTDFDLEADLDTTYHLEDGYSIVSMSSPSDYRKLARLRHNTFGDGREMTDEEFAHNLEIRNHSRRNPIYHANTDLCVLAPDGTFVSGCEALIDTRNLEADIERVCTHSDYRRRGYARAVIKECLHRLQEMGLKVAHISGYSEEAIGLYSSLGSQSQIEFPIYKLEQETLA